MGANVLTLAVELNDGTVEHLSLDENGPVYIGRDPACHVVLASPEVSRRHLIVEPIANDFLVTDNSANGTVVGDRKIHGETARVRAQTVVTIGPYKICLMPSGDERGPITTTALIEPEDVTDHGSLIPGDLDYSGLIESPEEVGSRLLALSAGGHSDVSVEIRRRIHRMLLDHLDLASLDRNKMDEGAMRPKVRTALRRIIKQIAADLPADADIGRLIDEMSDEALGLGPLEQLLADSTVSEIMVVDPQTIFVERSGKIEQTGLRFTDDEAVRAVIERIVTPLGRRIDESTPLVDARLKDGSRVNAIIRPLALRGACITIRKFSKTPLEVEDLIRFGSMTAQMARFLRRSVVARKNIVISGGTGSGKTTLLNVLSSAIPTEERIVTIEDAAELMLGQPHVVSLETRPQNMEGRGEYTIRDLVRNALRMRPDRIIVGECRGGEALDMLQAMNTGHEGSMTTTHANSPREAIARLETLVMMAGIELPARAIREQITSSVDVVLQQTRLSDGTRRVTSISEIAGIDDNGEIILHEIFGFKRTGTGKGGKVLGEFRLTGYLPSFLDDFIAHGLVEDGEFL